MSDDYTVYCNHCKRKEPPIETILKIDVNITESRFKRSDYICDDCFRVRAKEYRERYSNDAYASYRQEQKDNDIEAFRQQWEDPQYKNVKELSDKLEKVFLKSERTEPAKGIRRDWILEVIHKDLLNFEPDVFINEWLEKKGFTKTQISTRKNILLEFFADSENSMVMELGNKVKARNKFSHLVNTLNKKYATIEKLVATPAYEDPVTGDRIDNYYLLTNEKERIDRERVREAKKESFDTITKQEINLIESQNIRRLEKERKRQSVEAEDKISDDEVKEE